MIELSYPAKCLWPNSRPHWSQKWRATTSAKLEAFMATKAHIGKHGKPVNVVRLQYTLHPKPRGPGPDRDNIVASTKACTDGICGALGIDDRYLDTPKVVIAERRPNGALVVDFITE